MIVSIHDLFTTIRYVATQSPVPAPVIAGISRDAFHDIERGRSIRTETAQRLITVARKIMSPEVYGLRDGRGGLHLAPDFVAKTSARLVSLEAENAALRKALITHARTAA